VSESSHSPLYHAGILDRIDTVNNRVIGISRTIPYGDSTVFFQVDADVASEITLADARRLTAADYRVFWVDLNWWETQIFFIRTTLTPGILPIAPPLTTP
jgi:hypothetical protein